MRKVIIELIVMMMVVVGVVRAQTNIYSFAGLTYTFPTSHVAGTALVNNGSGTLSWSNAIPSNMVGFMNGACPSGWTELTLANGRYLVGTPSGGTNQATVGTALGSDENRSVGQHNHTGDIGVNLNDAGHSHSVNDPQHSHTIHDSGGSGDTGGGVDLLSGTENLPSAFTGISTVAAAPDLVTSGSSTSVNNSGSVSGTNAPYIVLRGCVKD